MLCDSALDHFAAPDLGVREMARVLAPGGRLILSFVNYASLSARVSRLWYRIDRVRAPEAAPVLRFWDSPVPHEHTFEGTYRNVIALCGQYLELDRVVGTSMLFGVPGWGALLRRLPERQARGLVLALDRVSRRVPGLADMLVTVSRHRREEEFQGIGGDDAAAGASRRRAPRRAARPRGHHAEQSGGPGAGRGWARCDEAGRRRPPRRRSLPRTAPAAGWTTSSTAVPSVTRLSSAGRAWPSGGCADASPRLDVFDPSHAVLGELRHRLGAVLHRARLARADLDFLSLPARRYDVVWSDDALRDVVNLEYLLDEIAAALRPGGLFAYHGYVAERRQRYTTARRARLQAALREIPARWRSAGLESAVSAAESPEPLCAVRADEILPLAKTRFEVVHEVRGGALFPIPQSLDLPALGRVAPAVVTRLDALERVGSADPEVAPALVYVVLRKTA